MDDEIFGDDDDLAGCWEMLNLCSPWRAGSICDFEFGLGIVAWHV